MLYLIRVYADNVFIVFVVVVVVVFDAYYHDESKVCSLIWGVTFSKKLFGK